MREICRLIQLNVRFRTVKNGFNLLAPLISATFGEGGLPHELIKERDKHFEPYSQFWKRGKLPIAHTTVNGITTTNTPGQEQYETFYHKTNKQIKKYVSYEYRSLTGELFSCTKDTLDACRAARDAWLEWKGIREGDLSD